MVRIDGHNRQNRQNKKTTLADRRKAQNHKPLEVGQTITAPTGDPKLRERTTTIDFSQQQPVVTNPQVTTENIELLNKQNEQQRVLDNQNKEIERIKKQIESEKKQLGKMNRAKNPGKYDAKVRRIKDKEVQLSKLFDGRAGIETNLENVQKQITKATEPAPAGDPLGMKKAPTPAPTPAPAPTTVNIPTGGTGTSPHIPSNVGGTGGTIIIGGEPQTKGIFPSANPEEYAKSLEKAEKSSIYPNRDPKIYAEQLEKSTPGLKLKPEGGKSSKGFWGKIFKSKGGKIGAGVALTGALVYGAYKLFGGDDNKNAEVKQNNPVQEQKATAPADTTATQKETPVAEEAKPEVKSETNTEAKPVVTPVPVAENDSIAKADAATEVEKADDAKAVVAKPETEETEEAEKTEKTEEAKEAKEAEEAKKAEEEFNEWIAQKGENYWKYAKQELIFEHQGQAGYNPTNKEINERMLKIMERNGVKFANDGIHSNPMLKIGDKVKVKFGTEEKAA